MRKKEELMGAMTGQEVEGGEERKAKKCAASSSSSVISASRVSQQEMAVQISTDINDGHRNSLSEILVWLEEEGLSLLNASSFETFDGKVFHNLHVQVILFSYLFYTLKVLLFYCFFFFFQIGIFIINFFFLYLSILSLSSFNLFLKNTFSFV